jgi:hypothetical protein
MKIGPVFAPIFKHHQKLIFDAERVGLPPAAFRLHLASESTAAIASNVFLWIPVSRRNTSPFSSLTESNLIVASLWRQRIKQALKEGYARGLMFSACSKVAMKAGAVGVFWIMCRAINAHRDSK